MTAGRSLDWEQFLSSHDYRYGVVVHNIVHDKTARDEAKDCGVHHHKARGLRYKLADELQEFMGDDAVADTTRKPAWWGDIHAEREKAACRVH